MVCVVHDGPQGQGLHVVVVPFSVSGQAQEPQIRDLPQNMVQGCMARAAKDSMEGRLSSQFKHFSADNWPVWCWASSCCVRVKTKSRSPEVPHPRHSAGVRVQIILTPFPWSASFSVTGGDN